MIYRSKKTGRPQGRPAPVASILGHPGEPFSVVTGLKRSPSTKESCVAPAVDFEGVFVDLQPAAAAIGILNSARDKPEVSLNEG